MRSFACVAANESSAANSVRTFEPSTRRKSTANAAPGKNGFLLDELGGHSREQREHSLQDGELGAHQNTTGVRAFRVFEDAIVRVRADGAAPFFLRQSALLGNPVQLRRPSRKNSLEWPVAISRLHHQLGS